MDLYCKQQLWCPRPRPGGSGNSSRSSSPVPHEGSSRTVTRRAGSPVSVSCRGSRHVTGTVLVSSHSSLSSGGVADQHVATMDSYDETAAPLHASVLGIRIADDAVAKQGTFDGNNYGAPEWEEVSPLISFDAEEHKYVTRCMPREHQRVGDMMGSFDGDDFEAVMQAAHDGEPSAATTTADEVLLSAAAASIDSKDHSGSGCGTSDNLFQTVCRRRAAAMAAEQQEKRNSKSRHRKAPLGSQPSEAWMLEVPTLVAVQCQQLTNGLPVPAHKPLLPKQEDPPAGGLSPRSGGVVAVIGAQPVQVQHIESGAAVVLLQRPNTVQAQQCPHAAVNIQKTNSRSRDALPAQAGAEGILGEIESETAAVITQQQGPRAAAPSSPTRGGAQSPVATAVIQGPQVAEGLMRARQSSATPASNEARVTDSFQPVAHKRHLGRTALKRALAVLREPKV